MKAVGHHRQVGHRSGQNVDAEKISRPHHHQPVERVLPKRVVVFQSLKWRNEGAQCIGRLMVQRCLQCANQMAITDRVLLVIGVTAVGAHVQRQTGPGVQPNKFLQAGAGQLEWGVASLHAYSFLLALTP